MFIAKLNLDLEHFILRSPYAYEMACDTGSNSFHRMLAHKGTSKRDRY